MKIGRPVAVLFIGVLVAWTAAPLLLMISTSFASQGVTVTTHLRPTLDSYRAVFGDATQGFVRSIGWSLLLATAVTLLTLLFAVPAAFALSRRWARRPIRAIGGWIFSTRFLPPIVAAIPLFVLFDRLHLLGTAIPLIAADLLLTLPFTTWVLKTYIDDVPASLDDLATVDGLSARLRILRVILPAVASPLLAVLAMAWLLVWNEYLFALLFSGDVRPVTVAIASWNTYLGIQWGPACAAGTLAMIPAAVVLGICGRYAGRLLGFGLRA